jgi:hypothetical protein
MIHPIINVRRHPELVSGSISSLVPSACVARWMLKQVQHDVERNVAIMLRWSDGVELAL